MRADLGDEPEHPLEVAVQPAGAGRHWDAATTDHVGRTTLPPRPNLQEIRTADTATLCQTPVMLQQRLELRAIFYLLCRRTAHYVNPEDMLS